MISHDYHIYKYYIIKTFIYYYINIIIIIINDLNSIMNKDIYYKGLLDLIRPFRFIIVIITTFFRFYFNYKN